MSDTAITVIYHGMSLTVLCSGQFYWWGETGVPGENHRPVASH